MSGPAAGDAQVSSQDGAHLLQAITNPLAVYRFRDKTVIICQDGVVHQAGAVLSYWAPASPPEMHHPQVSTASYQGGGNIRLHAVHGPDILLKDYIVRSILLELCERAPGVIDQVRDEAASRKNLIERMTGLRPDAGSDGTEASS